MTLNIENKIIIKMRKAGRGALFFTDSFITFGNTKAISKALERLVEKGEILRVARGIYTRPRSSKLLGVLHPTTEEIAQTIAKRDKARIIPTGAYALNAIGLSTQVPMNVVYLTDGAARKIKVGNSTILFKRTTPKNLATLGKLSGLAIQALKEIGKDKVTEEEKKKIVEIVKQEEKSKLQKDIRTAPEWIRQILKKAL